MKITSWNIEDDNLVLHYEHDNGGIYLRERKGMPGRAPVYEEIALDEETVANLAEALRELRGMLREMRGDAAAARVGGGL